MQILWTKGAELNLTHIEEYIAQDNPKAAVDTVHEIIKSIEILAAHPDIGRAGRILGTRELIISGTPYIVPYRIKAGRVEILRVLHGAMQWPHSLKALKCKLSFV